MPLFHIKNHSMISLQQVRSSCKKFVILRSKLRILSLSFAAICLFLVFAVDLNSFIETTELLVKEKYSEVYGNLVTPINVTQERIKRKLSELEILKPTPLTRRFGRRVEEFFGDDHCKIQFFMTWIAPVSSFGDQEFLAIESLFKAHPQGCLMIISRTMDSVQGFKILSPIIYRGFKVLAVTPDLNSLFKATPAATWFDDIKNGNKDPGEIPLAQNLSNLIRLAVLYKYGGVYLDTDFIVLKDFSTLRNSIGAQTMNSKSGNWTRLNNAVLIFDKNHPLLYKFIEEFASTFNGNKWGHNGPYLVSRVASQVAATSPEYNFTVLPPFAFYPVHWTRVKGFFHALNDVNSKWIKQKLRQLNQKTYAVHLWNKHSNRLRIEEGSIMSMLVLENCIICKHAYSLLGNGTLAETLKLLQLQQTADTWGSLNLPFVQVHNKL